MKSTVLTETIIKELNPAQKEAVINIDGPSLVIAGAGSGKTRVLTCRIANLIGQECPPSEILALTFTKKAATEMKERIASLVGADRARHIWMGTFHSIFIRFLRQYADLLGYPEQFTIYDKNDTRAAIRQCIKELELDEKIYKPADIASRISKAKNSLITCSAYSASPEIREQDSSCRKPRTGDVYTLYTKKCRTAGAMDFDDILLNTNILFRDHPEALETIAARFRYILVDEYQDTNRAQYLILRKLADRHHNLCVVGDDSQSIYAFRGARVENILGFKKDYPEARIIRLEQNYRSTQTIVQAANSLIAKNEHRLKKECYSRAEVGERIRLINAFSEGEEGYLIASSILDRIYREKARYCDFAILYRTNAQSRAIEQALRKKNLPYVIYSGLSFYDRAEVKDFLAYFRLCINPKDDEAFRRIINVPGRGIGDTTVGRVAMAAASSGISMMEAIGLSDEMLFKFDLKGATLAKLRAFAELVRDMSSHAMELDAYRIATEIGNRSGLLMALKADTSIEGIAKFQNVEELFNSIKDFVDEQTEIAQEMSQDGYEEPVIADKLPDYLENITLLSAVEREENPEDDANRITLMTLHASKGLEFPHVYIAGMEENLFPSGSELLPADIEEERRLFYVGLTRAQKSISLSFSKTRMKWGKSESNPVSRFVREINPAYIDGAVPAAGPDLCLDDEGGGHQGLRSLRSSSYGSIQGNRFSSGREGMSSNRYQTRHQKNNNSAMQSTKSERFSRPIPLDAGNKAVPHTPTPGFTPDAIENLKEGQSVEHDRFGFGKIISFDGDGADRKAIVDFQNGGKKTLLLKYAKLRIVNR